MTYSVTSKTSATTEATYRRVGETNTAVGKSSAGCWNLHSTLFGSRFITSPEMVQQVKTGGWSYTTGEGKEA
jgi:hypothetical protein